MTETDIIVTIKACEWRDTKMADNDEIDNPHVICNGYCEPCLSIINKGKCYVLRALFKRELMNGKGEES